MAAYQIQKPSNERPFYQERGGKLRPGIRKMIENRIAEGMTDDAISRFMNIPVLIVAKARHNYLRKKPEGI